MEIVRDKFTLRPFIGSDAEALAKHLNNRKIWLNARDYIPYPYSVQDAHDFFDLTAMNDNIELAIVVDGQAVGCVGIEPQEDVERLSAEIGYWLSEDYWGAGIVSEAVKTVCDYVFENTKIIRLFATVYEYNPASMRILEKAGFSRIGIQHKAAIKDGRIIDTHLFELVKK